MQARDRKRVRAEIPRATKRKEYLQVYHATYVRPERRGAEGKPRPRSTEHQHLYVMTIAEIPGVYKVGRSGDVATRRKELNKHFIFDLQVIAIYENAGHLELLIHDLLDTYRVRAKHTHGAREWFKCSTVHIHQTVMSVINSNSALSPEGDPLSPSGAPIRLVEH